MNVVILLLYIFNVFILLLFYIAVDRRYAMWKLLFDNLSNKSTSYLFVNQIIIKNKVFLKLGSVRPYVRPHLTAKEINNESLKSIGQSKLTKNIKIIKKPKIGTLKMTYWRSGNGYRVALLSTRCWSAKGTFPESLKSIRQF